MRDGWTETTLGDISLINPEATSNIKNNDEIVYIDLSSVSAETGIAADLFRGMFGEAPGRARRVVRARDVLVSTVRPYLRGFALVPEYLDGEVASTGFTVLRAKPAQTLPGLIWAVVGTDEFVDFLMDRATGSSYPAVRPSDVSAYRFNLPPIAEQRRIVDVVLSVDAYIDALQQQVDAARTARNAVLHELLSAGGDDWTETTLGAVAILNPKALALSKDAPFVPMDAVKVGQRFVTYSEPRGERSGARANSDDVLFARITPCLENGKVAQIQPELGPCGGSTEFIVIRGSEKISADFIYFWATWSEVRKTATGLMTGTTGRQRLSANDLAAIQILLPPIAEQKRIVEIVSSMDEVIQAAERAVVEAKNLRSGLLSDLLSGEHEIPVSYDELLGAA